MICKKCSTELPDVAVYCFMCGTKQITERRTKQRGNGQGSVFKFGNGWKAKKTIGWYNDGAGKAHRKVTTKQGFKTKKEALEWLSQEFTEKKKEYTLREIFDMYIAASEASDRVKSQYRYMFNKVGNALYLPINTVTYEMLQEAVNKSGYAKNSQVMMRSVISQVYDFAIPRGYAEKNIAKYIKVTGDVYEKREGIPVENIKDIESLASQNDEYAKIVLINIFTGFRIMELLKARYDASRNVLTGGLKTEAGKNRVVPISPRIQPYIDELYAMHPDGMIFSHLSKQKYTEAFGEVMSAAGIDNPIEGGRHRYTPHSCRHTFATLLKYVDGPDADKIKLIGHANVDMMHYYTDTQIEDLRKIINSL